MRKRIAGIAIVVCLIVAGVANADGPELDPAVAPDELAPDAEYLVDDVDRFVFTYYGVRLECEADDESLLCLEPDAVRRWGAKIRDAWPEPFEFDLGAAVSVPLPEPGPLGCDDSAEECVADIKRACRLIGERLQESHYTSAGCWGKCTDGSRVDCVKSNPPAPAPENPPSGILTP